MVVPTDGITGILTQIVVCPELFHSSIQNGISVIPSDVVILTSLPSVFAFA